MKDSHAATRHAGESSAAVQVVCLGSGGGPSEDNVTAFLVRATASDWAKGSLLAVDAGSHLSAITRILENDFPLYSQNPLTGNKSPPFPVGEAASPRSAAEAGLVGQTYDDTSDTPSSTRGNSPVPPTPPTILESGAFAGLAFPHASARANALHVVREHISTYLITHPHLDHHGGFVINTAAFHNTSRPKRLAALPFTVNAIKTHIFNNIIWPNLTDEDGGVGFITFQRLAEGGNIALGEGHGRGYIEVCDGLAVKGLKVSHGHCTKGPSHVHRGSIPNIADGVGAGLPLHSAVASAANGRESRSLSFSAASNPGTPLHAPAGTSGGSTEHGDRSHCVVDSTAYFIRAETARGSSSRRSSSAPPSHHNHHHPNRALSREVLIFGDVEPDSLSLSPRTARVWAEAAPKIAAGILTGVFIECSYTDAQPDAVLFGHLAPRHLIAELATLADMVQEARRERERERLGRKRKRSTRLLERDINGVGAPARGADSADERRQSVAGKSRLSDEVMPDRTSTHPVAVAARLDGYSAAATSDEDMRDATALGSAPPLSPSASDPAAAMDARTRTASIPGLPAYPHHLQQPPSAAAKARTAANNGSVGDGPLPLEGLTVVVIHVKDTLVDGPPVGEQVLAELREHEEGLRRVGRGLGCAFDVARSGGSYMF